MIAELVYKCRLCSEVEYVDLPEESKALSPTLYEAMHDKYDLVRVHKCQVDGTMGVADLIGIQEK